MSFATPRPAASLILLRDADGRMEVLVGRRHSATPAFPGVMVFPGGKLEPGDLEAERLAGRPARLSPAPAGAAFAALRETFEETGLWLSRAADGPARFPHAPGLSRLVPYAHWITPQARPYRFDTWFFLAVATPAEAATPLIREEFETLAWSAPDDLLAGPREALMIPTRHNLERLSRHRDARAALDEALASEPFDAAGLEL